MSAEELRNLVVQLQVDLMETNRQKEEGQGQIQKLERKLEATENTVRHISRKLKSSRPMTTDRQRANHHHTITKHTPAPTLMTTQRSLSEASLHRGDHWSRIYHGMLNDSCGGGAQGFWYGGPQTEHTDWEPLPDYSGVTNQGAQNSRTKSLSKLDGAKRQQPSNNFQRVKGLSSSCILSSHAKTTINGARPTSFVNEIKGDVDRKTSLKVSETPPKNQDKNDALSNNLKPTHTNRTTSTACSSQDLFVVSKPPQNYNPAGSPNRSHNNSNGNEDSGGKGDQARERSDPHSSFKQQYNLHQSAPQQYSTLKLSNSPQQIPPKATHATKHINLAREPRLIRKDKRDFTSSAQRNSCDFATGAKCDKERDKVSNVEGDSCPPFGSKPETEILNQLQLLLVEKEEVWRTKTNEMKQKMKKENFLLMQENELLHEEIKLRQENVNGLENTINELRQVNEKNAEDQKRLQEEIETLRQEKAEIEEDLANQDKELIDLDKTLCKMEITKKQSDIQKRKELDELEENKKELRLLKKELDNYKETNKSLKENLIKREASLQEQIFTVRKLRAEKSNDEKQSMINRTPDTIKPDVEFQRTITPSMTDKHNRIQRGGYGPMKTSHDTDGQHDLLQCVADLKNELRVSQETILKLKSEKERVNSNHNIQIADMENQLAEKEDLVNRLAQAEFELKSKKSLDEEIISLRSQLDKRLRHEAQLRSRIAECEAAVSKERTHLLSVQRELNEKSDKVKKRDKQCHELCEKFGKLDTAYIKQTKLLREKLDTIDFLKKRLQLQIYEKSNVTKYSNIFTDDRNMGSKL